MKKYWIVPVLALTAVLGSMAASLLTVEKPVIVKGVTDFLDGTSITEVKFEPTDAEDGHRLMVFKLKQGTSNNAKFAVHLNKSAEGNKMEIFQVVGDFPIANYCAGTPLECKIPLAKDAFEQSASAGVALYATVGQLIPITKGWADWDDHRALFSTNTDDGAL